MTKNDKKVEVKMQFAWTFTEKEWREHKEFLKDSKQRFDGDPITLWHFMCDITTPELLRKAVDRVG